MPTSEEYGPHIHAALMGYRRAIESCSVRDDVDSLSHLVATAMGMIQAMGGPGVAKAVMDSIAEWLDTPDVLATQETFRELINRKREGA